MNQSRGTAFLYLFMLLLALVSAGPFLWLLSTALKGPEENLFAYPPRFIPRNITLGNFAHVFAGIPFPRYLMNSFFTAGISVALNLGIAGTAAYPLARMAFPGKKLIFMAILSTMMIPFQVTMIPIFLFVTRLGLKNSYAGLVLPTAVTAFGIFLIRQAFLVIPRSLEEAALIRREKNGRKRVCHLQPGTLQQAQTWLDEQAAFWTGALDALETALKEEDDDHG